VLVLQGSTEVGVFAAGVALHAVEGIGGVLLAVAWGTGVTARVTSSRCG